MYRFPPKIVKHSHLKRKRYGSYYEVRNGEYFASVNIPLGKGKYRKKRKKVSNPTEARQWAVKELNKTHGTDAPLTFTELADWYSKEFLIPPSYKSGARVGGLRTYERQQTMLDRLTRTFGFYRLDNITVDVLRRYKRDRLRDVGITAVNRDFALMRTMFKKAGKRKWMENPFDYGEGLVETALEPKRANPITTRMAKRLLARSRKSEQPLLHYVILVLMFTGARPSEVYPYEAKDDGVLREPLIWQNVLEFDFQAVRLVSYKGRIREERVVPSTLELESGLKRLYTQTNPTSEGLIFPVKSFKRSWATLCRSVGVSGIRLRDFRKYYNTVIMTNPAFNDAERMLLMGHTEIATNLRYAGLDERFFKKYREAASSSG